MIDAGLELLLAGVRTYGWLVVFGVFVLEGALVGKLLPSRVVFLAAALAVGTTLSALAPLIAAAVLGATVGQVLLFGLTRRVGTPVADVSFAPEGGPERSQSRARGWLDRWGLHAVAVSNALPLVRGTLTVPTARTGTPWTRFSASALVGSTVYVSALAGVAVTLGTVGPALA